MLTDAECVLEDQCSYQCRRDQAEASLKHRWQRSIADDLIGAPGRWRARAALGWVAYSLGDDEAASSAYETAAELIASFAETLAPERAKRLVVAPEVAEVFLLTGHAPAT